LRPRSAVKAGDEIALRNPEPGLLSKEARWPRKARRTRAGRRHGRGGPVDAQLGRFSLKSDQTAPYAAFVDLAWLQETIELPKKANLIVAGESRANAQEWLRSAWTLEISGW